jgi:two-component system sensor histidine kinase KdpD
LREVAEEVESKRIVRDPVVVGSREERVLDASTQAVGERLLALVTPRPQSQRLVRRAWRSSQRLGGELDLLWVENPSGKDRDEEQLEALRKLAAVLGAHLLIEPGDDVAETAARVARERGTTYILLGQPSERGLLGRFSEPLVMNLMRRLPGVDLRIVADRTQRDGEEERQ